ncbi:helix-turn-helix domain-containing protein [Streptomyces buecherae]|uniref:helix-turn-helix domain-containing protein n=1 Tax=Streptomyces buecherae TaxID=2763006 RepID=UPI001E3B1340|nr:helix-turn-helix transcriptional regulator [Streptomyces buecherae]
MREFADLARTALHESGYSIKAAARATKYDISYLSRVLNGKQKPSVKLAQSLDALVGAGGELAAVVMKPADPTNQPLRQDLPDLDEAQGEDFVLAIRNISQRLITLDNEVRGLPIAGLAACSFKVVHRRLGEGEYALRYERDIQSAAAELAEIAGWALFNNEGQFDAARRFSQEALFLAGLCGDRSTELITLQNLGMIAGWAGRPREELAIARSVLRRGRLTPRVEAVFRAREGQGLAGTGDPTSAARAFDRARALLQESSPRSEPHWAWWISLSEIDRQQGRMQHETGQWIDSIPTLERATERHPGTQVGYENVASVRLLDSLVAVKSWRAAEEEAAKLIPTISETSSGVTLTILRQATRRGKRMSAAPNGLRDALDRIDMALNADPYEL